MLIFKNYSSLVPSDPCCCSPNPPSLKDLDEMVAHYRRERRRGMLTSLYELFSIGDCVFGSHNETYPSALSQQSSDILRLHPHFTRRFIAGAGIDPVKRFELCQSLDKIRLTLEACTNLDTYFNRDWKSFEEFHDYLFQNFSSLPSIGVLIIYDIALRFAWHYTFDGWYAQAIVPNSWVYIHAGAERGADTLLGNNILGKYKDPTAPKGVVRVPRFIFPEALQSLSSYEIEDFLCIYQKPLAGLVSHSVPTLTPGKIYGIL